MDHFKGTNEAERFNNALLNEIRKTNQLLEQIAQLLQPKVEKPETAKRTRRKSA